MARVDVVEGSFLSNFLQNTLKSNQVEINTDSRTLRPVAKLKEPRDLFALPKEIDCPQQAARWPSECQVLEDRVIHIEYTPPMPESYYQPTGNEIQPRPVGDEAGTIVFQYYPTSAVNYFSRSSVGGTRYYLSSYPQENEDNLRFESRFESGNLAKAVKITETYYELSLRTDLYTNRHMQWFYFQVSNTRTNIMYRFSIVNLSKGDSLYSFGMKPLLYSTKDAALNQIGWRRCGDNISYFRNDSYGEDEQNANYILSFNLEFPHDNDVVYLAHCYPYTYSDLQDYLIKLQNHPIKSTYSKLRLLCRSLAGNNVYYLTVTSPCLPDEPKKRKAVVITGRVHPGETPSSWMMKGFMDYLTGDSEQAKELRDKFIFKLVPMLNPDGVIVGNNRCSLTGRDLNRQYRTVIRETYPSIWHTKLMIRRLMEECGIVMYCDLHAHSRKHNVFIYGCENKRYPEKRLYEQVFPLMLHKNAADKFSFENCKFRIQRSKEGTGRVVIWMMGVCNSYTMEASFGGSTIGSRVDTHFSAQDYENIGRAFCETLLDFCDEDPCKERLRSKIVSRLVKEGSSADEPTNINLSDYSSDEGDTSSCTDDETTDKPTLPASAPPSSPLCPRQKGTQKLKETSPKTNVSQPLSSYSSPLPRKILQVHCANLDIFNRESDVDSGGESPVGGHISRSMERNNIENFQFLNRGHMPPELMITTAQVYDMQIVTEGNTSFTKETNDTKDFYSEACQTDSDYSWSPERSKSQVTSKTTILRSDFSPEIRVGFHRSVSLQQRLWGGSDLEAGLLTWSSPILCTDTAILRSCSHKLSLLKEHRGKGKAKSTNREKKQEKASLSRKKYKQAIMRVDDAELTGEQSEYAEHTDVKYTKLKKKKIKKKGLGKQSLEIPQKALRKGGSASSSSNSGGVSKAEIMKIQNQMPEDDKATRSRKKKKQRFVNIHRKIRKIIDAVTTSNGDRSVCSNED